MYGKECLCLKSGWISEDGLQRAKSRTLFKFDMGVISIDSFD